MNATRRPAHPNNTRGRQVLSDLSCLLGCRQRDALTLIKAAICRLFPRQAESRDTAGATNYQLFWKRNLSGVEYESGFVCPDSESHSLAGVRLVALGAKDRHLSCYF